MRKLPLIKTQNQQSIKTYATFGQSIKSQNMCLFIYIWVYIFRHNRRVHVAGLHKTMYNSSKY